jgi:hypothetical protein
MSIQKHISEERADSEAAKLQARVDAARAMDGDRPNRRPMLDPAAQAIVDRAQAILAEAEAAQEVAAAVPPRPDRKPFGRLEQSLAWPPIPGMRLYWFNDTPGRIDRALEAGYAHVDDKNGCHVSRITGKGENSRGLQSFLMQIPEQWYRDDQRLVNDAETEKLRDILEGRNGSDKVNAHYVPQRGIKIASGVPRR